jgi:hypothetical protein
MKAHIRKFNKGASERKIDIHVDKWDTYNMDHTAALLIYPLLVQLKNSKHGIPSDFAVVGGEDYSSQYSFEFYSETRDWAFDKSCEKWDETLDRMIWSFYQVAYNDLEAQYTHDKPNYKWVKDENTNSTTIVQLNQKYWHDHIGNELAEKKVQEGLDLFAKHFRTLWD